MKKLGIILVLALTLVSTAWAGGNRNPSSDDQKMANGIMKALNDTSSLKEAYTEAIVWKWDDGETGVQLFASDDLLNTMKGVSKETRNEIVNTVLNKQVKYMIQFARKTMNVSKIDSMIITDNEGTGYGYAKLK